MPSEKMFLWFDESQDSHKKWVWRKQSDHVRPNKTTVTVKQVGCRKTLKGHFTASRTGVLQNGNEILEIEDFTKFFNLFLESTDV